MKRNLNKIMISVLFLMLLLLICPMFLVTSNATENTRTEYESVDDYVLKNDNGTSYESGAIYIENAVIKDFSDISSYTKITNLSMYNVDIGDVDGIEIPSSVEHISIIGSLKGSLSLTRNTNLEYIVIGEMEQGDLANAVIDIRGLEKIYSFCYTYIGTEKYILSEKILMDDYSIGEQYDFTSDDITTNVFRFDIYNNLSHYYEKELKWSYESKLDVTEINFWQADVIKDISDIDEFTNLESISINSGEKLTKGTYTFSNNKKLKEVDIFFNECDLSKIVIDIRNMDCLKHFSYYYNDCTGFELKKSILMDDYNILNTYLYEDEKGILYGGAYFDIYESVEEYLTECYSEMPREEITDLSISNIVKSYTGLSTLTNLKELYLYDQTTDLSGINLKELTKLESVHFMNCKLNGTLDFTSNKNLTDIWIKLSGDLSKAVVNIKGMDWLTDFCYEYPDTSTGFELKKCILMDNYDILEEYDYEYDEKTGKEYSFSIEVYNTIDEYLEVYHSEEAKDEITNIDIGNDIIIKDCSGLSTLTNLEELTLNGQALGTIDFSKLSKLKSVEIVDCKLNGTLDFTKNTKLTDIDIKLSGNLSKAVVKIKGMNWLEIFKFAYYNATNFNLKDCILVDNYDSLKYSTYESYNGKVEVYSMVKTLEEYLIENGVDSNSDGKLSTDEWKKVKNLALSDDKIDITGIEKAVNLERLDFTDINPELIDFSKLSNLEVLSIDINDMVVNLNLPIMKQLEELNLNGINNIDISKLTGLKYLEIYDRSGKIEFPSSLENLEYLYCDLNNSQINLSQSKKIKYAYLSGIETIENITFPKDKYITYNEEVGNISIKNIDKEITIQKDCTYTFYDMEPTCEKNDIIEISNIDSYEYKVLAKKVGTTNIKFIDDLKNEIQVKVTVVDNKIDTSLENTGITAKIIYDGEAVLKSNGELWKMNSETTAEKIDTNVRKYVPGMLEVSWNIMQGYENILKNDNTLVVRLNNNIQKSIPNVRDMNENVYLTSNGELYELGINYITQEINPKKILSNVKKIVNKCIVLNDGTTWYQEIREYDNNTNNITFKKLADFEIKDCQYIAYKLEDEDWYMYIPTVVDLNNNLWACKEKDYEFNDSGLEKIQENFSGYENEYSYGAYLELQDGKAVLNTREYNEETGEYEVVSSKVILTDVTEISYSYADVMVRTDGSIWLYDQTQGLTKITKSTVVEEEKEVEEKKEIPFTDVSENIWYYDAVKYVYENNMIKGINDTTFDPNGNLTRGMLVTIIWRMEGSPKATTNQFTDVSTKAWYYDAVNWAAANKIVNGYGEGKFGPDDNITREQLAVILKNYAGVYKKKDVSARADLSKFADNSSIASYARDGVSWAVANKIISGKENGTKVDPKGKATRSEAAAMLRTYCLNVK